MAEQQSSIRQYEVILQGFKAVILYPSLVTPALVGPEGCMSLILALEEEGGITGLVETNEGKGVRMGKSFYKEIHLRDPSRQGNKIGEIAARVLHSQLMFVPWGDGELASTHPVTYNAHKENLTAWTCMIYGGHNAAIDRYKNNLYQGWYLGKLPDGDQDYLVQGYDHDGQPRPWGVLHRGAVELYRSKKYTRLFQLNFKQFSCSYPSELYELVFMYYKVFDDEIDKERLEKAAAADYAWKENDGPPIYSCYTDPDDDLISDYFGEQNFLAKLPEALRTPERIVTKITGNQNRFRLYDPNVPTIDVVRPGGKKEVCEVAMGEPQEKTEGEGPFLQARHPVYLPKQWQGRIGVLGDLHLSSRQALYKLVNTQVIPGADPDDSPYLGKIAHENLSSVSNLMTKLGDQCDMLALAGDLYDHTRNCDPAYFAGSIKKSKDLWAAMDFTQHQDNHDAYPRNIDGLWMLSKILHFYNHKKKPVVYVNGNHEAYELPYGVSPRLPGRRANDGIPADHNLTIYEACLLYGPKYRDTGMAGGQFNFRAKNYNWLYSLFTPWKDCMLSYHQGEKEHNFICLGWGQEEEFVKDAILGPGSLPRAPEACTKEQLQLVQWAANRAKVGVENSILSHFTFACYATDVAFEESRSATTEVGVKSHTKSDIGSFNKHRQEIYSLIQDGSIRYTISGHSHRAGVHEYPQVIASQEPRGIPVSATVGDGQSVNLNANGRKYTSLVCGSAGPFGCRNLRGELAGLGMDLPQGFLLDLQQERLNWVKDERAKPRLAVVMDYLWYLKGCVPFWNPVQAFAGIFRHDGQASEFYFCVNHTFRQVFGKTHPFEQMSLIAVGAMGTTPAVLRMQVGNEQTKFKIAKTPGDPDGNDVFFDAFTLRVDSGGVETLKIGIKRITTDARPGVTPIISHFLSITFREIPGLVESKHYDLNSPWCFPVEIVGDYKQIYRIGDANGELPNFEWYGERWKEEHKIKAKK